MIYSFPTGTIITRPRELKNAVECAWISAVRFAEVRQDFKVELEINIMEIKRLRALLASTEVRARRQPLPGWPCKAQPGNESDVYQDSH